MTDITASDEPYRRCQKCAMGRVSSFYGTFMRIQDGFYAEAGLKGEGGFRVPMTMH